MYSLCDANFNVIALADTSGDIQERYCYNAYGKCKILTSAFVDRASSLYDVEYLYTGRRTDPETGLMHYRNRYYHAQLGRFINRDPIGYGGLDINLYRYVGGMPIIDLQGFAGHADPRTTLAYIRSQERLSKSPTYVLRCGP